MHSSPPRQDHTRWSDKIAHAISEAPHKAPPTHPNVSLAPQWRGVALGGLHLHDVVSKPQSIEHEPRSNWRGIISLLVQSAGSGMLLYRGQRLELHAGQGVLLDASEPMSIAFIENYRQVFVLIPRALLGWVPRDAFGQRLDQERAMDRPALELTQSLSVGAMQMSPRSRQLMARALISLVRASTPIDVALNLSGSPHLARALCYIAEHSDDPELSATRVADAVSISRRRLDELFGMRDTTITAHITQTRLERAAVWLRTDPQRTITNIALSEGFKDPSHFSRLFKQHTGVTPTQWRSHAKRPHDF